MRREILRLALPAFLALVAEPLFLLADSAIVGHLGVEPLAALGVASAVLLTAAGVFVFLAYGTTSVVARRLGAGDERGAVAAGVDGLWLSLALGTGTAVGVALAAPGLAAAFGASAHVQEQAVTYLRIAAAGIPGMLVVLGATGLLRGLQDTRTPLLVATIGFAVNIVLNLLFVYGLGLGLAGSAIGTAIAQSGMAAALVGTVLRAAVRLHAPLRPHTAGILTAALGGVPLLVRTLALRTALLVTTAVAARYGDTALAAHQVVATVWSGLAFALDALAIAAQALTGKALGAADVVQAREAATTLTRWGMWAGVVTGLLLLPLAPVIGRAFSPDPAVVHSAAWAFVAVALGQALSGYVFVADGILMGAGDTVWLAGAMLAADAVWVPLVLWGSRGGAVLPGGFGEGLAGLWVWFAVGFMALRAGGLSWRLRGDGWLVTGAAR